MFSIKDSKSQKLENALSEKLQAELEQPVENEDELFVLADYDQSAAEKSGYSMRVLKAVEEVNERQKSIVFEKLAAHFGGADKLEGRTIAIWGLAFKPETDDMREATSLVTIERLLEAGCRVKVFDPVAMDECRRRVGDVVEYAKDMYDAVLDADALLMLTEWKQFRLPSWGVIARSMKTPVIIDGRNIYDADDMKRQGFEYHCIGRR